jgi:hypothetical protein
MQIKKLFNQTDVNDLLQHIASLRMSINAALVQRFVVIGGIELTRCYTHGSMQLKLKDCREEVSVGE